MVETFGAHYVSLHVRVSNKAAIHLYRDTLGFKTEKTEAKYYADGEDAFCMRLELAFIRNQLREAEIEAADDATAEAADEGDAVGDVGRDPKKSSSNNNDKKKTKPTDAATAGAAAAAAGADKKTTPDKDKKRKVKVGRGLGVGELVERDESKHS